MATSMRAILVFSLLGMFSLLGNIIRFFGTFLLVSTFSIGFLQYVLGREMTE